MKFNLKGPFAPFPKLEQEPPITDYKSFWAWFVKHERRFMQMLKIDDGEDNEFSAIFLSRLMEADRECAFRTKRDGNGGYEIVFNILNHLSRAVIAEDVAAAAPVLEKWRFSAFTKASENSEFMSEFDGFTLDSKDVYFFSTEHPDRPNMVDITVTCKNCDKIYQKQIIKACEIFIQYILGQLEMLTQFDRIEIRPTAAGDPDLIPVAKLPAFLRWREKEFVEKYTGVFYDKKQDRGSKSLLLQSKPTSKGLVSMTTVDRFVMRWNETAAYPWILTITLAFNGTEKGMPDESTLAAINSFQKDLGTMLEPHGYLFLLHDTYDNINSTYIASNEFMNISRMTEAFLKKYNDRFTLSYDISLDKYWSVVDTYRKAVLLA